MAGDEATGKPLRIRVDVAGDRATEFVSRLAEDDDFRARLQERPAEVLWDYGFEVSAEFLSQGVQLPSKEDVQHVLEQARLGQGSLQAGPQMMFPIFVLFFAFPFLSGER
jgi:hypothetical protein